MRHLTMRLAVAVACGVGALSMAWAAPESRPASRPAAERPHARESKLTAEQEKELLDVLRERMPDRHERLMRLKREQPEAYQAVLHEHWRWYSSWKQAPRDVQDAFVAEQRARLRSIELARKYQAAVETAQREKFMGQLRQAVADEMAAGQKVRQYRLGQAREQLERLKAEINRRTEQVDRMQTELDRQPKDREKRIDERVQRVLRLATQAASRPFHPLRPATRPAPAAAH